MVVVVVVVKNTVLMPYSRSTVSSQFFGFIVTLLCLFVNIQFRCHSHI